MKSLNNIGVERLGDALGKSIDNDAKLSIISSHISLYSPMVNLRMSSQKSRNYASYLVSPPSSSA